MFNFDLLENEKVVTIYRQSEATLFKPVLLIFLSIYFPWFFLLKYELAENYLRLLFFWTILVLVYALRKYLLWMLNTYLLTDQRLVQIAYHGLFNKQIIECPLDRILNVSFKSKGFWQGIFGFGTVEVQVMGLKEPLELSNIAHPSQIKDLLWRAHSYSQKHEPTMRNFSIEQPIIMRGEPLQSKIRQKNSVNEKNTSPMDSTPRTVKKPKAV